MRSFLKHTGEAAGKGGDEAARRSLVCILPHGASSGETFELADLDLHLRINRPVRFQIYTSTRHDEKKAGDVVELDPGRIPRPAAARDGRDGRAAGEWRTRPARFPSR